MKIRVCVMLACLLATLLFSTCACGVERLKLATTTSVENSGLLAYLLPHFERECSCVVDVIAVGTGQALKAGSTGDVDLVMVHAPDLEEMFVADGHGVDRRTFMRNEFVIVGPPADPAAVGGTSDATRALSIIREMQAPFISRGDESGTHHRERQLWQALGVVPQGDWYKEAGQGMGAVLTMAGNIEAYTLSDIGTYLARTEGLGLEILVKGDPNLVNPYSVIAVNLEKGDWIKRDLARRLMDWLCSEQGQELIGAYEVKGTQLFVPTIEKEN